MLFSLLDDPSALSIVCLILILWVEMNVFHIVCKYFENICLGFFLTPIGIQGKQLCIQQAKHLLKTLIFHT